MIYRYLVFCFAIYGASVVRAQEAPGTPILPPVSNYSSSISNPIVGDPNPTKAGKIFFSYTVTRDIHYQIRDVKGEISNKTKVSQGVVDGVLDLDCDLDKIDLPDEGKRAGVQAVSAARHTKLLNSLKEANTVSEKEDAAKKLEANYRAHYAVETEWRLKRLTELEKKLEEMRAQLKERTGSEDKYVEAAMTLAKLHAQGIAAEPPKLSDSNSQANGMTHPIMEPIPTYGIGIQSSPSGDVLR